MAEFVIDGLEALQGIKYSPAGVAMTMPVALGLSNSANDLWTLPIEPTVSIRLQKQIIRREVYRNKSIGTVKELFGQGDYEITISGILVGDGTLPRSDLSKLRRLVEATKSLVISCELTTLFGIEYFAVERFELPETPGEGNQRYILSGYSDTRFVFA